MRHGRPMTRRLLWAAALAALALAACAKPGAKGEASRDQVLAYLDNHPEVTICTRCSYSIKTWAWENEDQAKTG